MKKTLFFWFLFFTVSFILTAYQVGDTVGDFSWSLKDEGLTISRSLYDLTGKNKTVMIAFGDDWCARSRSVIPYLQQLSESMDEEKFILLYDFSNNSILNNYFWSFDDRDIPYYIIIDSDNTLRYSGSIMPSAEFIRNLIENNNSSVPVFRFFNTVRGGHLYTVSDIERDHIIDNLPEWNYEGISFEVYLEETGGIVPSYRFFNTVTGIHLYTISEHERDHIIDNLPEWNYEGESFYVYPTSEGDNIPVYRFFNTLLGGHLYTINGYERDHIIDNLPEWNYEGISFYVYPHEEVTDTSLPKTGQTEVYRDGDDGYHQMGVLWPEPRFTDNDDGTVTDNLTGLMWTKNANLPDFALNWNDAIDFCNDLDHGGYTDWRLPNVRELFSLMDISECIPALPDGHPFTNIMSDIYWSSTTYAINTGSALRVRVGSWGNIWWDAKSHAFYVWAVRGTSNGEIQVHRTGQTIQYRYGDDGTYQMGVPWPSPRFTDHDNGTVTDELTGLMWIKSANLDGTKTWNNAIDNCNNLVYAGYSDWRLPNVRELQSIIDYSKVNPVMPDGHPFADVVDSFYWSSSTNVCTTDRAWRVSMSNGGVNISPKTNTFYVWPVRAGD